jgi:hypothetical protein
LLCGGPLTCIKRLYVLEAAEVAGSQLRSTTAAGLLSAKEEAELLDMEGQLVNTASWALLPVALSRHLYVLCISTKRHSQLTHLCLQREA